VFFSEEKAEAALREPKDFCYGFRGTIPAMASIVGAAQE
jgi:hypothetical protein